MRTEQEARGGALAGSRAGVDRLAHGPNPALTWFCKFPELKVIVFKESWTIKKAVH